MSWANFCSKCPGLNKQTKNLSKFEEEEKKIIVRFSADLWKFERKKIEKLKKLSFGCHFGRKRREKSREISVKFENLEKKNE